jgi:hypothetical protein
LAVIPVAGLVGRPDICTPVPGWTAFVAGLWCSDRMRLTDHVSAHAARRALFALTLAAVAGCTELAQPSEAAAPPFPEPPYAALAAKYLSSAMRDRTAFEGFEISGPRWVHSLKGWSWLACVHFLDHGHLRTYALFMQNDVVVEGRYAVQSDSCAAQSYTPFDMVTGVLGRPTAPEQPALY